MKPRIFSGWGGFTAGLRAWAEGQTSFAACISNPARRSPTTAMWPEPAGLRQSRTGFIHPCHHNSEYNQHQFAARCAIDATAATTTSMAVACGDAKRKRTSGATHFGRPVELDKLVFFLRAAWTPTDTPHDSWWQQSMSVSPMVPPKNSS